MGQIAKAYALKDTWVEVARWDGGEVNFRRLAGWADGRVLLSGTAARWDCNALPILPARFMRLPRPMGLVGRRGLCALRGQLKAVCPSLWQRLQGFLALDWNIQILQFGVCIRIE
jgi:hypothetical protein